MTISRTSFLQRIMKYCAAAERSTFDVLSRLEAWGVQQEEINDILGILYKEKFLDDRRYASSYVREKWNLDGWGKIKMEYALQRKNIDEKIIYEVLKKIDHGEYLDKLHALLSKKLKEIHSSNKTDDAGRLLMYALSRGFEEEYVREWIEKEVL